MQLNDKDAASEFLRAFGKERPLGGQKGHMFFCAPLEEQLASKVKRQRLTMPGSASTQQQAGSAAASSTSTTEAGLSRMSWESTYSEGQVSRLRMYEKAAAEALWHGIVSDTDEGLSRLIRKTLQACLWGGRENKLY